MGCGASVPSLATEDQKKEMMQWALKEMMIAIGTHAISNGKDVKVKAPADKLREFVAKLRKAAEDAAPKEGEPAGAEKKTGGGMLGAFGGGALGAGLNAAAGAAAGALEAGKDLAQQGVSKAITGAADGIDTGLAKMDAEFEKVGNDVTNEKGDVMIETYKKIINEKTVDNPVTYIWGKEPHGLDERKAVAKDAVSRYITDNTKAELIDKMLDATKDAVKETGAVKAWKKAIDSFNDANTQLGNMGDIGAKLKQEPITLDIERYIVEQIVTGYHDLMAKQEEALRSNPSSVSGCPKPTTFERCWSPAIEYNAFKANHYADFQSGK